MASQDFAPLRTGGAKQDKRVDTENSGQPIDFLQMGHFNLLSILLMYLRLETSEKSLGSRSPPVRDCRLSPSSLLPLEAQSQASLT